jgi:hypothetical protein
MINNKKYTHIRERSAVAPGMALHHGLQRLPGSFSDTKDPRRDHPKMKKELSK